MAVDLDKLYLFHNIYGDAQSLIDSAADDVVLVPWGPAEAAETIRDNYINDMNKSPGSVPSVMYYKSAWTEDTFIAGEPFTQTFGPEWTEIRLSDIEKDNWNWEYIRSIIT